MFMYHTALEIAYHIAFGPPPAASATTVTPEQVLQQVQSAGYGEVFETIKMSPAIIAMRKAEGVEAAVALLYELHPDLPPRRP